MTKKKTHVKISCFAALHFQITMVETIFCVIFVMFKNIMKLKCVHNLGTIHCLTRTNEFLVHNNMNQIKNIESKTLIDGVI